MTIKGIVFDFDGLIIDTETPELKAWQELFESYDIEFPFQEYIQKAAAATQYWLTPARKKTTHILCR